MELVDIAIPALQQGEALVRVQYCTVCGSDLHTISGARVEPTPSILGHEVLGVVSSLGDPPLSDISGAALQPGDRVTWSPAVSCGSCDRCLRGLPQKCRELFKYGHAIATGRNALSGGLAEYILLRPGSAVVRLDADIPDEVLGPASCATATVAAALRVAGEIAGQRVLIFGAGMLGVTAAAFAKSGGAAQVAICDPNPQRLQQAIRFGADHVVEWSDPDSELPQQLSSATGTSTFDIVLELSGAAKAVEASLRCGDIGAEIVLVGSVMDSPPVELNPTAVVRNWLSIHGVHNYAPQDLLTAVEFLRQHHATYPFAELVESTFALADVNAAMSFAQRERPIRVAIRP